jgi:hypothetical protein
MEEQDSGKSQFIMDLEETNMKKHFSCLLLVVGIIIPIRALAQEHPLPFLRDVVVRSSVRFDPTSEIYSYFYTVKNGASNEGRLISFEIDVSRDTSGALLDDMGLRFKNTRIEDAYRAFAARLGDQIVPISFPSLPKYCDAGLTIRRTADFFGPLIQQGQEVDGFILSSKGVPAIRRFVALPQFEINDYYPSADEVSNPDSLADQISKDRDAINYHGVTLGPTAPPIDFVATTWCDTLLSYTRQSVSLGWLKNTRDNDCDLDEKPEDGVANNFEKRLTKVRTEPTDGDTLKASKELEKFIKKVERVSKRNEVMTSEAYALLKYNAEYLVGRIITLPTRSAGTLLQQIDELKAEVQNQQSKKNVGGLLLVKGLTALLDVAKQRLQQTDSMQTAIAIGLFQLTVDETNQLTDALLEKNKPLPPLYVKDEAYIQLHYRAKYILEALPELRIDLDLQRQQMMDKELRQELDSLKQKMEQ